MALQWIQSFYGWLFPEYQHITSDDELLRIIDIELIVNGHPVRRSAIALIDSGCPINLMSRSLAAEFGIAFGAAVQGEPILDTIGNGNFKSIGKTAGRWACKQSPCKPRFGFDPKYYEGIWEVSEYEERYDIIIGRNTIKKHGLFKLKRDLAAPASYRFAPRELDKAAVKVALMKQAENIKINAEKRRQHETRTTNQLNKPQAETS